MIGRKVCGSCDVGKAEYDTTDVFNSMIETINNKSTTPKKRHDSVIYLRLPIEYPKVRNSAQAESNRQATGTPLQCMLCYDIH